jgi:hypothetical protein
MRSISSSTRTKRTWIIWSRLMITANSRYQRCRSTSRINSRSKCPYTLSSYCSTSWSSTSSYCFLTSWIAMWISSSLRKRLS